MIDHETVKAYIEVLQDLHSNDRARIVTLTELAKDNKQESESIALAVEQHILTCPDDEKLYALYVLDSIVKNIGEPYVTAFAPKLNKIFCNAWDTCKVSSHKVSFTKLLRLWVDREVFTPATLAPLQRTAKPLQKQAPSDVNQRPAENALQQVPIVPLRSAQFFTPTVQSHAPQMSGSSGVPPAFKTSAPKQWQAQPHAPSTSVPPYSHNSLGRSPASPLPNGISMQQRPNDQLSQVPILPLNPQPVAPSIMPSHFQPYPQAHYYAPQPAYPGSLPGACQLHSQVPLPSHYPGPSAYTSVPAHSAAMPFLPPAPTEFTLGSAPQSSRPASKPSTPSPQPTAGRSPRENEDFVSAIMNLGKSLEGTSYPSGLENAGSKQELKSTEFAAAFLKEYHLEVVQQLHELSDKFRSEYLQRQFIKRKQQRINPLRQRQWFTPIDQWLSVTTSSTEAPAEVDEGVPAEVPEHREPRDEEHTECAISGEPFEEYYDKDTDTWWYRNATRLHGEEAAAYGVPEGALVNVKCLVGDRPSSSVQPPPLEETVEETMEQAEDLPSEPSSSAPTAELPSPGVKRPAEEAAVADPALQQIIHPNGFPQQQQPGAADALSDFAHTNIAKKIKV